MMLVIRVMMNEVDAQLMYGCRYSHSISASIQRKQSRERINEVLGEELLQLRPHLVTFRYFS